MSRFDLSNDMHAMIVGAHYQLRLEGRNPAGIDDAALLEALATAVPVATEHDIVAALRREAARLSNEADALEQFLNPQPLTGEPLDESRHNFDRLEP